MNEIEYQNYVSKMINKSAQAIKMSYLLALENKEPKSKTHRLEKRIDRARVLIHKVLYKDIVLEANFDKKFLQKALGEINEILSGQK